MTTTPVRTHVHPRNGSTAYILPDRPGALAHYPHLRRVGDLLFVSGLSSRRPDNTHDGVEIHEDGTVTMDITAQTEACIRNLEILLAAAGATLEDVVDMTTFLVSMDDFPGYNAVYNRHFAAETGPTRTTVAVAALPHPHLLIELKAVAAVGSARYRSGAGSSSQHMESTSSGESGLGRTKTPSTGGSGSPPS